MHTVNTRLERAMHGKLHCITYVATARYKSSCYLTSSDYNYMRGYFKVTMIVYSSRKLAFVAFLVLTTSVQQISSQITREKKIIIQSFQMFFLIIIY